MANIRELRFAKVLKEYLSSSQPPLSPPPQCQVFSLYILFCCEIIILLLHSYPKLGISYARFYWLNYTCNGQLQKNYVSKERNKKEVLKEAIDKCKSVHDRTGPTWTEDRIRGEAWTEDKTGGPGKPGIGQDRTGLGPIMGREKAEKWHRDQAHPCHCFLWGTG